MKAIPPDCPAIEAGYVFGYLPGLKATPDDAAGGSNWWGSGDYNPDGGTIRAVPTKEAIPDGERCGSKTADVLSTSHYNDWGSLFGFSNFVGPQKGDTSWEGLAFWARAPGNTTKGFTLLLDDPNTSNSTTNPGYCVNYPGNDQTKGSTPGTGQDGTPISTSGSATFSPYPEACGNSYSVVMLVTGEWAFYAIPFSKFQQDAKPNRVPNERLNTVGTVPGTALLTDKLTNLIIRFSKEANTELWIDDLAFYKKKQ